MKPMKPTRPGQPRRAFWSWIIPHGGSVPGLKTGLILVFGWASAGQALDSAAPLELNLAEAIALALRQNRVIENAYLTRIVEKFDLRLAEDEFSPQYQLGAALDQDSPYDPTTGRATTHRYQASSAVTLRVPTGGQLALTAAHDADLGDEQAYNDNVTLSFSHPLLKNAGRTVGAARVILARRTEQSHLLRLKETVSSLITQVIKQYRAYVAANRELAISRLSLERSREQLAITREFIRSGRMPAVELVQSETDVANQQLDLRSTENRLDAARIQLVRLLRLPPDTPIQATEQMTIARYDRGLEELKTTALSQRVDIQQARLDVANAELTLALARNARLWALDLETHYGLAQSGRDARPLRSLQHPAQGDFHIGLSLTVPLFDLEPKHRVTSSRVALKIARNNLRELEETIVLELLNAHRDLQIRWEQLELNQRSVELSRKQLALEQDKLKVGRSSSFQVVSFQNRLVEAEYGYLNARISYLDALTDLDESLGTTLRHWGVSLAEVERQQPGLDGGE